MANLADGMIEDYLQKVYDGLRRLPEAQVSEIVEELRSHLRERAESDPTETGVRAALERLGRPEDLASLYVAEEIVPGAEGRFSPWLVSKGLLSWAALSSAGVFVFLGSLAGYALAAALTLCALRKPFAPERVGLWKTGPDSVSLTLGFADPPSGTELLGWWIVPLGLLMGTGIFLLTARAAGWFLQRFKQSNQLKLQSRLK